jgi:hypothetical protein
MFSHPETGEVLESQDDFLHAIAEVEEKMQPFWKLRRALREAYAERYDPILPRPQSRSQTQERVARCPRCGGNLTAPPSTIPE